MVTEGTDPVLDRAHTLGRLKVISGLNGGSVVFFGVLCVAGTILLGGGWWALLCVGIVASGVMELIGRSKLEKSPASAGKWLKASQLWLLALVLGYCAYQILSLDAARFVDQVSAQLGPDALSELGLSKAELQEMITKVWYGFYGCIIVLSLLYQGGLWLYYWSRTRKLLEQSDLTSAIQGQE